MKEMYLRLRYLLVLLVLTHIRGRHTDGRSDGRHTDGRSDGRHTDGRSDGRHTDGRSDGRHTDARSDGRHTDDYTNAKSTCGRLDGDVICTKCTCCRPTTRTGLWSVSCTHSSYRVDNPLPLPNHTAKKIKQLSLRGYKLNTIKRKYFTNLPNLTILKLPNNGITTLDSDAFRDLDLMGLSLNYNMIDVVQVGSLPRGLRSLEMVGNRLTNLTFLRGLKLKNLNVNRNYIRALRSDDVKNSLSAAYAKISITSNGLNSIEKRTFEGVNLTKLNLSNNELGDTLADGLQGLCVNKLYLINVSLWTVLLRDQWTFTPSCVTHLDLSHNNITDISNGTFQRFSKLVELHLERSQLDTCQLHDAFTGLYRLETLILRRNPWLNRAPDLQHTDGSCSTPNLRLLDVSYTGISILKPNYFTCLTNLRTFSASFTGIWKLLNNTFKHARNLEKVDLYSSRLRMVEELAFEGTRIKELNIGHNMYIFRRKKFWNMPHLKILKMQTNHFDDQLMPADFFINTPQLERLKMNDQSHFRGFTNCSCLHETPFRNLTKLKKIDLDGLNLGHINWNLFRDTKLQRLSVKNNQIRIVTYSQIPEEIVEQLRSFDLSNNRFDCGCELLEFRNWVCDNPGNCTFPGNSTYKCRDDKPLCKWEANLQCSDIKDRDKILTELATGTALIFILVPLTVGLSWHYRYRIKYAILTMKVRYWKRRAEGYEWIPSTGDQRGQLVWYADEPKLGRDIKFVREKLVPLFEQDLNVKLIIKDRDGQFSGCTIEAMIECIERSQRVILVVSEDFCHDTYARCVVEHLTIKMVNNEPMFQHPIIILREEIEPNYHQLGLLMRKCTDYTIQWPDEETQEALDTVRTFLRQYLQPDIQWSRV